MSKKIPTTIKDQELVAQRRSEIVDVATRLFLERGFHKTSIRDIARACPFNLASLYMYVTSKEDILFLVAQQLIDEKARAMNAVKMLEDDPAELFDPRCAPIAVSCTITGRTSGCSTANLTCFRRSGAKSSWLRCPP